MKGAPVMAWVLRNSRGEISGQRWDTSQLALAEANKVIAELRKDGLTVRFRDGRPGRAWIYERPQDTDPIEHIRVEDEKGQEVDIPVQ
jgi:hypothetical protein